jgi:hypothetical protein
MKKINDIGLTIIIISIVFFIAVFNSSSNVFGADINIQKSANTSLLNESLVIDGNLSDKAWQGTTVIKLKSSQLGVPAELGGNVNILIRGNYLYIGSFCPEPGGKVIAKSVGYNPFWAKDLPDGVYLEDRIGFSVKFKTPGGGRICVGFGNKSLGRL